MLPGQVHGPTGSLVCHRGGEEGTYMLQELISTQYIMTKTKTKKILAIILFVILLNYNAVSVSYPFFESLIFIFISVSKNVFPNLAFVISFVSITIITLVTTPF